MWAGALAPCCTPCNANMAPPARHEARRFESDSVHAGKNPRTTCEPTSDCVLSKQCPPPSRGDCPARRAECGHPGPQLRGHRLRCSVHVTAPAERLGRARAQRRSPRRPRLPRCRAKACNDARGRLASEAFSSCKSAVVSAAAASRSLRSAARHGQITNLGGALASPVELSTAIHEQALSHPLFRQ